MSRFHFLVSSLLALFIFSCGGSSGSRVISTSTTLTSSNLSGVSTTSFIYDLGLSSSHSVRGFSAVSGLNDAANPCPTGTDTCYSPTAVGGKFSSFNIRVATSGTYYRLQLISGPESDDNLSSADLNSFELGDPDPITGSPDISGVSFNESSHFSDLIWNIGWIDAKFAANTFGAGIPSSETVLRFVYFDDPATGYQSGDVLIKDGSSFKWCNTGATNLSGCSTTRPGTPITQDSGIVNYTPAEGDPVLPYLSAGLSASATNEGEVTTSEEQLAANGLSFTVDFDHEDAFAIAKSGGSAPTLTTIFDVMPRLYLRGLSATPTGISVAGGINAVLTVSNE